MWEACHRADIGPTRDVIHDGGRILVKTDPTALAEHIIALLSDPLRREQMSGRKKTLAHFT